MWGRKCQNLPWDYVVTLLGVFQPVSPSCHELQALCPEGSRGRPRREDEAARMGRAGESLHHHPTGKSEPTVNAYRFLVWARKMKKKLQLSLQSLF